jgi:hypothetical protein
MPTRADPRPHRRAAGGREASTMLPPELARAWPLVVAKTRAIRAPQLTVTDVRAPSSAAPGVRVPDCPVRADAERAHEPDRRRVPLQPLLVTASIRSNRPR